MVRFRWLLHFHHIMQSSGTAKMPHSPPSPAPKVSARMQEYLSSPHSPPIVCLVTMKCKTTPPSPSTNHPFSQQRKCMHFHTHTVFTGLAYPTAGPPRYLVSSTSEYARAFGARVAAARSGACLAPRPRETRSYPWMGELVPGIPPHPRGRKERRQLHEKCCAGLYSFQ